MVHLLHLPVVQLLLLFSRTLFWFCFKLKLQGREEDDDVDLNIDNKLCLYLYDENTIR